jgi:hypothetical protein
MNLRALEKLRDKTYRRTRARRVRTMGDAARFIDEVGFCLLFASTHVPRFELPSLFEAVKGRRDARIEDWDEDTDRVWVWKNDLPARKRAYYGKALAGKPVFVSIKMLPCLLALNARDVPDEYRRGRLSHEARRVYDTLQERGPMPTMALRAAAGFQRDTHRYHQSLDELQRALIVMPVGAVIERGAWPSQIFGLTAQWFPRQLECARKMNQRAARRAIVRQYLQTARAAQAAFLARLFGFAREDITAAAGDLIADQVLRQDGDWLIING